MKNPGIKFFGMLLLFSLFFISTSDASPQYYSGTGNYYDAVKLSNGITYSAADSNAQSLSYNGVPGHLVTVTSQGENEFLVSKFGAVYLDKLWMGAYQPAGSQEPTGGWKWVTGEPWSYTNWYSSEPSNAYGGDEGVHPSGWAEDAAQFAYNVGKWNDYPSDIARPGSGYVVEYETSTMAQTTTVTTTAIPTTAVPTTTVPQPVITTVIPATTIPQTVVTTAIPATTVTQSTVKNAAVTTRIPTASATTRRTATVTTGSANQSNPGTVTTAVATPVPSTIAPQATVTTVPANETPKIDWTVIIVVVILVVAIGGLYIFSRNNKKPEPPRSKTSPAVQNYQKNNFPLPSPNPSVIQKNVDRIQTPSSPKTIPPDIMDHYTDVTYIGKGGFARVYRAKRKDGTMVAIKVPISIDASTGKTFIAEMQNWTKLNHNNIVRVFDYNIMPIPYFEMELCDSSLADMKKPIGCVEAAWILFNICEGLKYTHARSIVHRDLKPQNILLKNGTPKISDWGLSKIISESTSTTSVSFTPCYAAPEQIGNKTKDERTDIWQLGVILYELVTGTLPFSGDSIVEIMSSIATKQPRSVAELVPAAKNIEPIILKCLDKDPAKRYQTVVELQKDLGHYLNVDYADALSTSLSLKNFNKSAWFCGDLVLVNLKIGDLPTAYKYLNDLAFYSYGENQVLAKELAEQIKMRLDHQLTEVPDELIQKAEFIVHKVSFGI